MWLFIMFSQATSKQYNEIVITKKLIVGNSSVFEYSRLKCMQIQGLARTISGDYIEIIRRELQVATETIDYNQSMPSPKLSIMP